LGVCGKDKDILAIQSLLRLVLKGTMAYLDQVSDFRKGVESGEIKPKDKVKTDKILKEIQNLFENGGVEVKKELPKSFARLWDQIGISPEGIARDLFKASQRLEGGITGVEENLLWAFKSSLLGCMAYWLQGNLKKSVFGDLAPAMVEVNLGVLKKDAVNIALHGHNPLLSDIVAQVADEKELNDKARAAGAREGINVVGVCCTGNEVMMRHKIPLATSSVSQEAVILTGALDAMVVDYQCIMPALAGVAECYHTRLITTMPIAKIPKALHIEFHEANAKESARKIIETAIEAFRKRDAAKINIPDVTTTAFAGFSTEAIVGALALVNKEDPLKPLIDNIVAGNIYGVCLFAGCNTVKVTQDANYTVMIKELAKRNVLILATGCASGAFARHGFMTPEATEKYAGPGLKAVLTAVGQAAGLGGPLPLVLHMGSCVDNSRAVDVAVAVANKLGVDLHMLPVVASAPEPVTEKAVAIGTWAVAAGLPTHIGVVPPVLGSKVVTEVLTSAAKDLFGGYFIVETDPVAAAEKLIAVMGERRKGLGLSA